jgi:galactan 5-O-arabinofuranosyltransferase
VLLLGAGQVLAGQGGSGVLFHRLLIVLGVALLAAGVLGLSALAPRLVPLTERVAPAPLLRRVGAAGLAVFLFLSLSGHAREWMDMHADLRKLAHDVAYPSGSFPPLASDSSRSGAAGEPTVVELARAADQAARAAGQRETGVVLTDDIQLLATTPLFGYLQWWELYSNPLGEYRERRADVEHLAGLSDRDPGQLAPALRADPAAPTVFVLRVAGDEVTYSSAGWDPGAPRSTSWSVRFPLSAFSAEDFVTERMGDRLVAALRAS